MSQANGTTQKPRSVMPPIELHPNGHPKQYLARSDDAWVVQSIIGGKVIQMRDVAIEVKEADIPQLEVAGYEVIIVEAQAQ